MYNATSSFFWYKVVFVFELVLAEGLVTYSLGKKPYFALRVLFSVIVMVGAAFAVPIFFYNAVYSSAVFIFLFLLSVLMMKFCYAEPMSRILFCGILAYVCQHIAYVTCSFIINVADIGSFAVYSSEEFAPPNAFMYITYFAAYAIMYWIMWAFLCVRLRKTNDLSIKNHALLIVASAILLCDIILNAIVVYHISEQSKTVLSVLYCYDLLSCTLAIGILFSMMRNGALRNELAFIRNLWSKDKMMYEIKREKAELIEIKCHDMKHRLREFGEQLRMDESAINQMVDTIEIYDSVIKTGNRVLDVVLSEEGLYCQRIGIKLYCDADGAQLNFLPETDLYSLFDNAMHNAIDAVSAVEDPDKRIIKIKIARRGGYVSIRIENYFLKDRLKLVNGVPITNKEDKSEHGFGIKSMRLVASKFDGGMNISVEDDLFILDMIFPIPESTASDQASDGDEVSKDG